MYSFKVQREHAENPRNTQLLRALRKTINCEIIGCVFAFDIRENPLQMKFTYLEQIKCILCSGIYVYIMKHIKMLHKTELTNSLNELVKFAVP